MPRLPKFPRPKLPLSPIQPLRQIMRGGREQVEKARDGIRSIADELHGLTSTPEITKEPPILQSPTSTIGKLAEGIACLPCSRDHFLTTSAAISEAIRFAREKGVRDPEVVRRIRIALGELDVMERIDLAPEEIAKLKGAEKKLADWTLKQSRELRHTITAIRDVETMEQAAARASNVTDEFMGRLWAIPEEECETCGEMRESINAFIEKRKRERAGAGE